MGTLVASSLHLLSYCFPVGVSWLPYAAPSKYFETGYLLNTESVNDEISKWTCFRRPALTLSSLQTRLFLLLQSACSIFPFRTRAPGIVSHCAHRRLLSPSSSPN